MDARIEQLVFNDIAKDLQKHLKNPMTLNECKSLVDKYSANSVEKHNLNASLSISLSKKFFDTFITFDKYKSKSDNPFERLKYNSNVKEYFIFKINTAQLQNYSKIQQQQKQKSEQEVDVSNTARAITANDLGREF